MVYTLHFKFKGKEYSNFGVVPARALPNQFEAIALGLLLWKIEHENLSRSEVYNELTLLEYDENKGVVTPVWAIQVYQPLSEEVK